MYQRETQPNNYKGCGGQEFANHKFGILNWQSRDYLHCAAAIFFGYQTHGNGRYEKQVNQWHNTEEGPHVRLIDQKEGVGEKIARKDCE